MFEGETLVNKTITSKAIKDLKFRHITNQNSEKVNWANTYDSWKSWFDQYSSSTIFLIPNKMFFLKL